MIHLNSFPLLTLNLDTADSSKVLIGKTLSSLARLYQSGGAPSALATKALSYVKVYPSSIHILEGAASTLRICQYAFAFQIHKCSYDYRVQNWVNKTPTIEPPAKKKKLSPNQPAVDKDLPADGKQPAYVLIEFMPLLAPNLAQHNGVLRLATLDFLATFAPPSGSHQIMHEVTPNILFCGVS